MPEPAPSNEAVMIAVTSKEATPTVGQRFSPEQAQNHARAKEIQEHMAKKSNNETIAGFLNRNPKKGEMLSLADANTATRIDPETGEKIRDDGEKERFKKANDSIERAYSYIEGGVDKMPPIEMAAAMAQIDSALRLLPGANDFLNTLPRAEVSKMMAEAMRDPNFRNQLLTRLDEVKAKGELPEGDVTSAEAKVTETEAAMKLKEKAVKRVDEELEELKEELAQHKPAKDGEPRTKGNELDEINRSLERLETESKEAKGDLSEINDMMQELKRQAKSIESAKKGNYEELQDALKPQNDRAEELLAEKRIAEEKIVKLEEAKARKDQLEREKADFRTNRRALEEKRDEAEAELDPLRQKDQQAKMDLAKARRARVSQEAEFVTNVNDLFADTAIKYYGKKVADADAAQREILDKQIGDAQSDLERDVIEQISDGRLWMEKDSRRGKFGFGKERESVKPNEAQIDADYKKMLLDGPNATLEAVLTRLGVPAEKMREMLDDPQYKEMMTKQILAKRMETKGISDNEARAIVGTEWGNQAIESALATNTDAKSMVDRLRSNGVLHGNTPAEWIKQHPRSTLAAILLMLLTPAAAVGTAALAGGVGLVGAGAEGAAVGAGAIGIGAVGKKIGNMPL